MSWLSALLDLDKNPTAEAAVNTVANAALTAAEAVNPTVATVATVAESIGSETPAQATATITASVAQEIEAKLNDYLTAQGVSASVIAGLDSAFTGELTALGLSS